MIIILTYKAYYYQDPHGKSVLTMLTAMGGKTHMPQFHQKVKASGGTGKTSVFLKASLSILRRKMGCNYIMEE